MTRDHGAFGKYPTKEWDMTPFREALERFIKSEDIIVKRPSSRPASDQPISSFKPSKHSILSLLQFYDLNKVFENLNERPPGGISINEVQTQTNLRDMPTSTYAEPNQLHGTNAADGDDFSGKRVLDEDEYNEGSFPSYGSICKEDDEAHNGMSSPQNLGNSSPDKKSCLNDVSPPKMMLVGIPSQVQPSQQQTQAPQHEHSESYALTADGDDSSGKSAVDEDEYDEESFPSYDSTCYEEDDAYDSNSSPRNDGDSQPNDGTDASPRMMHEGRPAQVQPPQQQAQSPRHEHSQSLTCMRNTSAFATEAGFDVSSRQFLQHNQKGCAWVFDMN